MFESVVLFFERQSWLANLLYFLGLAVTVFMFTTRRLTNWWLDRHQSLDSYIRKRNPTLPSSVDELLHRLRVVVVDDEPDSVPTDYLRRLGLEVFEKPHVSLADAPELGTYDLIFLDIVGVVEEDPKRGGLALLERLKSLETAPMIVAISSKKFDPLATDFFRSADDVLNKPISPQQAESTIRDLLRVHRFPGTHIDAFQSALDAAHLGARDQRTIIRLAKRSIDGGRVTSRFAKAVAGWPNQRVAEQATKALAWLANASATVERTRR